MKAQFLPGLSAEQYHADPAPEPSLSSSIAKILLTQSPRHACLAHPRLNAAYVAEEPSNTMDFGSAAHALLLERDEAPIVWIDAPDFRTKAAQEARDDARAAGKFAVLARHKPTLVEMVKQAWATIEQSEFKGILETGEAEQTLVWADYGHNGPYVRMPSDLSDKVPIAYCRARFDLLASHRGVIIDYKSTTDASPDAFIRQIARMGYDVQAEFYCRGLRNIGYDPLFVFLVQENTAPFACSLVGLSNAYREIGKAKVMRAVNIWAECMRTGTWPSYTPMVHYAEPAAWQLQEIV